MGDALMPRMSGGGRVRSGTLSVMDWRYDRVPDEVKGYSNIVLLCTEPPPVMNEMTEFPITAFVAANGKGQYCEISISNNITQTTSRHYYLEEDIAYHKSTGSLSIAGEGAFYGEYRYWCW